VSRGCEPPGAKTHPILLHTFTWYIPTPYLNRANKVDKMSEGKAHLRQG
jgi:hypothetical protein